MPTKPRKSVNERNMDYLVGVKDSKPRTNDGRYTKDTFSKINKSFGGKQKKR